MLYKMRHLLNAREITIKHSKKTLLDKVSFALKEHDKAVIVGRNGSGKTTLLTILAGENEIDDGELVFASGITIGYLPQEFTLPQDLTIHEVLQQEYNKKHIGSWVEDHLVQGLLRSFDLPEFTSKVSQLSGGQHRRVALLKALLLEPDILLLDEPTNHLDLEMIKSLETIIREYPHACVIISHDRYFVDRIATKIIEIDNKQLHTHKGGYKDFLYSRETRITNNEKAEEKKQDFLRREIEWVHAGVRARGTKNKGRLKAYYDLKKEEVFKRHIDPSLLIPTPPDLGSKVLRAHNVTVKIGDKTILKNFDFKFEAGFKLGLIGPNGSGKTTLLKTITGERKPTIGKVAIGDSTIINYHDQNRQHLNLQKSILDEIAGGAERIEFGTGSVNSYSYLKRFLFNSEQIRTVIQNLSGGEKARVLLAKLFKISSNFLILDEPTNDLDIETLGVLEQSLNDYSGCMILVSHDRYFLNALCTHILSLEGDGTFILSTGNYDDFLRKYKTDSGELELIEETPETAPKASIPTKIILQETTKLTNQETRKLKKELTRLESQIEILELQIADKETKFTDPEFFKQENLNNFVFGIGRDKKQLEVFQTRWLEIGELLGL
jgi:ABC transport system ATP-binding/permease protein